MFLTVEKVIKYGISHAIDWHTNADNKYTKVYSKNKESLYL